MSNFLVPTFKPIRLRISMVEEKQFYDTWRLSDVYSEGFALIHECMSINDQKN